MVATKMTVGTPTESGNRRYDRLERLRANRPTAVVRVVPGEVFGYTEEDIRRVLRHPRGMAFRPEGSIEWPDDAFTRRRLAEGAVKLAEDESSEGDDQTRRERRQERRAARSEDEATSS